jgi:hypothetical protein
MPKDNCLSLSARKGKVFHVIQPVAVLLALLLYKIDQGTISGLYIGAFIFFCGLAGLVITGPFLQRSSERRSRDFRRVITQLCDFGFLIIGLGLIFRI